MIIQSLFLPFTFRLGLIVIADLEQREREKEEKGEEEGKRNSEGREVLYVA